MSVVKFMNSVAEAAVLSSAGKGRVSIVAFVKPHHA
jgi:hypothetical protein